MFGVELPIGQQLRPSGSLEYERCTTSHLLESVDQSTLEMFSVNITLF